MVQGSTSPYTSTQVLRCTKQHFIMAKNSTFQFGRLFRILSYDFCLDICFYLKQIPTNLLHHSLRGYFLFFLPPAFSCAYRVGHPHPRYASPFPMGSLAFSQWEHPILARSEIQCCALSQQSTQEHWACRTHGEPGYSISGFPGLDQNLLDPFCAKPVFLYIVLCID